MQYHCQEIIIKKEERGQSSSGINGTTFRQLHNTIYGIINQIYFLKTYPAPGISTSPPISDPSSLT